MEAALYESLGRKQAALENESQQYRNLLGLLARIKAGEVSIDDVTISLEAGSWVVQPATPEVPSSSMENVKKMWDESGNNIERVANER